MNAVHHCRSCGKETLVEGPCDDCYNGTSLTAPKMVKLQFADKATTGSKWADRMVNEAVDSALLRLKPIIRDELRKEIKRLLQIEEIE